MGRPTSNLLQAEDGTGTRGTYRFGGFLCSENADPESGGSDTQPGGSTWLT